MFENLKKLSVQTAATRKYHIDHPEQGIQVVVEVTSATEANPPYWSARLRTEQEPGRARKLNPASVCQLRGADADLFAAHVVRGWVGVTKDDGTACPYSQENARAWLVALATYAPHVFDELRAFCKEEDNFTSAALNPDGVAKNL